MVDLWSEETNDIIMLSIIAVIAVLIIFIFVLWLRLRKLRKRYVQAMNGFNQESFEEALINMQNKIRLLEQTNELQERKIVQIHKRLQKMKAHVGFKRYNAFQEHGSDLSFSIAFIDDHKDGFVLTGIHGREETYVYAKALVKGEAKQSLSPEEKQVIEEAQSSFKTGME